MPLRASCFVFRLGAEWLALPMALLDEVVAATVDALAAAPSRSGEDRVLSVRGDILVHVSLAGLLGIPDDGAAASTNGHRRSAPRVVVLADARGRLAISVDEVMGIHRYDPVVLRAGAGDAWTGDGLVRERAARRRRSHCRRARWRARAGFALARARMSFDDVRCCRLFQLEARTQALKLSDGLIALESERSPVALEELMRAAHSLKGAARIVGHEGVAAIAHELEECFVAAQEGQARDLGVADRCAPSRRRSHGGNRAVAIPRRRSSAIPRACASPWSLALRSIARGGSPSARRGGRLTRMAMAASPPQGSGSTEHRTTPIACSRSRARRSWRRVRSRPRRERRRTLPERPGDRARLRSASGRVPPRPQRVAPRARMRCTRPSPRCSAARRERAIRHGHREPASLERGRRISTKVCSTRGCFRSATGSSDCPAWCATPRATLGREVDARHFRRDHARRPRSAAPPRRSARASHPQRRRSRHRAEPRETSREGKPPRGTIRVEARHGGGRLLVSVQDDGRGLDFAAVRARVDQRGLAEPQAVAEMSDAELSHFPLPPGLHDAGRGDADLRSRRRARRRADERARDRRRRAPRASALRRHALRHAASAHPLGDSRPRRARSATSRTHFRSHACTGSARRELRSFRPWKDGSTSLSTAARLVSCGGTSCSTSARLLPARA